MRIYAGADEPCITRDHVFFLRNEPVCVRNVQMAAFMIGSGPQVNLRSELLIWTFIEALTHRPRSRSSDQKPFFYRNCAGVRVRWGPGTACAVLVE